MQTDATLMTNNSQDCWMLHVACYTLLHVAAQSLKPVKLFSQQLPTFLLFLDRVAQQCWIRLHSSSNIVGVKHAHYAWITKTYGLYSSHDALQVPNLLGVVASVCTPLPTLTQQLPTLLRVVAPVCTQPYFAKFFVLNTCVLEYRVQYEGMLPHPAYELRPCQFTILQIETDREQSVSGTTLGKCSFKYRGEEGRVKI